MQAKTIKKIISNKFSSWVDSINDLNVKELVEKNTIITGGCITSMLLNEPVNDFDVYFRNQRTAEAVARYYVNIMGKGEVKVDGDRVTVFIKSSGFTGTMPEDGHDDNATECASKTIDNQYSPVYMSSNAITLSDGIQLILRFHGEPDVIHENYDFAHCLNYWTSKEDNLFLDKKEGDLVLDKEALECTLAKELRYKGSKYPLCSIFRTRKFIKRGWNINAGQYLKMALQLNELDLTDVDTLEDQLTGVDSAFFLWIIGDIKRKEIKTVDSSYITTLIDKIF